MKIWFLPADEAACCAYRMRYAAEAARDAADLEFTISMQIPRRLRRGRPEPEATDADLVVFQRPATLPIVEMIAGFQRQGTPVVVDLDDDFGSIPPQHVAWHGLEPSRNLSANWEWIAKAAAIADLVTVSKPALAERYGKHGRVRILRNCIPRRLLSLPRASDSKTLGWAGWAATHVGDLEVPGAGIAEALRGTDWHFKVIGPAEQIKRRLALDTEPDATGSLPLDAYQEALGCLDVGIVPLAANRFNQSKSGLKGLEYAARGVPFVASPTPEYMRLAADGIGVVAAGRPRNWRSELRRLIADPDLHAARAHTARNRVAEAYTYEHHYQQWLDAWKHAAARRSHASVSHVVRRTGSLTASAC